MSVEETESIRVLVVDDQRSMRAIIRRLLGQVGIKDVVEAANGDEAFAFLRSPTDRDPDVIV